MKRNSFRNTRYLTQDDVGSGLTVTVEHVVLENVSAQGEKPKEKSVIYFSDFAKPWPCILTNYDIIVAQTGLDDSDDWTGLVLDLWVDPTVRYNNKSGGIRVKAARMPELAEAFDKPKKAKKEAPVLD
jgi:hypothetical protein